MRCKLTRATQITTTRMSGRHTRHSNTTQRPPDRYPAPRNPTHNFPIADLDRGLDRGQHRRHARVARLVAGRSSRRSRPGIHRGRPGSRRRSRPGRRRPRRAPGGARVRRRRWRPSRSWAGRGGRSVWGRRQALSRTGPCRPRSRGCRGRPRPSRCPAGPRTTAPTRARRAPGTGVKPEASASGSTRSPAREDGRQPLTETQGRRSVSTPPRSSRISGAASPMPSGPRVPFSRQGGRAVALTGAGGRGRTYGRAR
jgi:hypothetical protein